MRKASMATRAELIEAIGERYRLADRESKGWVLDEFEAVTGFHRKHAMSSAPGFLEAVSFESCNHIEGLEGCIVIGLSLGGRDVADGAEEAMVVEPFDPVQGRHFDRRCARP